MAICLENDLKSVCVVASVSKPGWVLHTNSHESVHRGVFNPIEYRMLSYGVDLYLLVE